MPHRTAALDLANIAHCRGLLRAHIVVSAIPRSLIHHRNPLVVVVYLACEISGGHHFIVWMRNHQEDIGLKARVWCAIVIAIPVRLGFLRTLSPERSWPQRTDQSCDDGNSHKSGHRFTWY